MCRQWPSRDPKGLRVHFNRKSRDEKNKIKKEKKIDKRVNKKRKKCERVRAFRGREREIYIN